MPDHAIKALLALGEAAPWRLIPLWTLRRPRHPLYTLVSAARYAWARQWNWNAAWHETTPHKLYAKRNVGVARSTVYLGREILKIADPKPKGFVALHHGDHVNGQPLDNRDDNLRWATPIDNRLNRIGWEDVPSIAEIVAELLARAEIDEPMMRPYEDYAGEEVPFP